MPPSQQQTPSQYDFILNNQPRRSGPNFGQSKGQRIAVVVGGLILLIIIVMVISSFLNSGSNGQKQQLIDIAKSQTEIIRVSALAQQKAVDPKTKQFALNVKLSVQSDQSQVMKSLEGRGVKAKSLSKTLAASKNPKNDTTLDDGTKNNRFDDTFLVLLQQQLTDYQKQLKIAFDASGSNSEKTTLTNAFNNVTTVTKNLKTATTTQ